MSIVGISTAGISDVWIGTVWIEALLGAGCAAIFAALLAERRKRVKLLRALQDVQDALRAFSRGHVRRLLPEPPLAEIAPLYSAVNRLGSGLSDQLAALREQLERHRLTLRNMQDGVLVLDQSAHVMSINAAGARLLDTEVETVLGRDLRSFGEKGRMIVERLVAEETIQFSVTYPHSQERWLQARATPLRDSEGRAVGKLIELADISEVKRFEQARQDFVANVSHELKTPITSIQGYVETLLDGGAHSAGDRERFLRIIASQASRLSSIVVELLSLARLESEQRLSPDELSDVSLRDLLEAAQEGCEPVAAERGMKIHVECSPDLRWRLNRWLIEQAVMNLIDNSVKYGNPGSVVRVIARMEARLAVISVVDESGGIPPEHLPRLFERFYRIDKARSRKAGGSGLGLSIVKHIAAVHGGKVLVESEVGRGSIFSIVLPSEALERTGSLKSGPGTKAGADPNAGADTSGREEPAGAESDESEVMPATVRASA